MTTEPLTTRILKLLSGMSYATTESLTDYTKEPRPKVVKTLRDMRERRKTITTDARGHAITDLGREALLNPTPNRPTGVKRVSLEKRSPQSEFLLAKPSQISVSHENSVMRRPTWTPDPWIPARPGADDHKLYASRGIV